jgi:hypothetical protein
MTNLNTRIDNDSYLMISIFQAKSSYLPNDSDPDHFVRNHAYEIEKAGRMLTYLGLAEKDNKSVLGWRPTYRLLKLIAKRMSRRSPLTKMGSEEGLLLHFFHSNVFADIITEGGGALGYEMFEALGLVRYNDMEEEVVTREFKELFASAVDNEPREKRTKKTET